MRNWTICAAALFVAASAGRTQGAPPPAGQQREAPKPGVRVYLKHAFGKGAVIKTGAGALWDHVRTSPHEWGGGPAGLGRRFSSIFAGHLIKSTVHFTIARVRDEELDYQPSGLDGFKPRLKYALLSTVITRKTTTGQKTIASGEIAGAVTSGFLSRLWYPARLHTFAGGLASSGISLGADTGFNVAREFWPEIRHPKQRLQDKRSKQHVSSPAP